MTQEEIEAHDRHATEQRARRAVLPTVRPCGCCGIGTVRQWPTGALECDNPHCTIMGADISEFNPSRKDHMRHDVLQLTQAQIAALYSGQEARNAT